MKTVPLKVVRSAVPFISVDSCADYSTELLNNLRSGVITEPIAACEICDLGSANCEAMDSAAAIPVQWPPTMRFIPAFLSHKAVSSNVLVLALHK